MPRIPVTQCGDCGVLFGHPVVVCRECGSKQLQTTLLDGIGTVYAGTTIRVPDSDHSGQEPYHICLIDVGRESDIRVTARVEGPTCPDPGTQVRYIKTRDGIQYFAEQNSDSSPYGDRAPE